LPNRNDIIVNYLTLYTESDKILNKLGFDLKCLSYKYIDKGGTIVKIHLYLLCITLFLPLFSQTINADELLADVAENNININLDMAIKLAMLVSYHAEYSDTSGLNYRVFYNTDRIFIGSIELQSLDGKNRYYAITLYRGEDEPRDIEKITERVDDWVEIALTRITKKGENLYEWDTSGPEFLNSWMLIYKNLNEYREYFNCVVPASTGLGFASGFHKGISDHYYMNKLLKAVLARHLDVSIDAINLLRATPDLKLLCEVEGNEYIVYIPKKAKHIMDIEIVEGKEVKRMIERSSLSTDLEGVTEVESKAMKEDIIKWMRYVLLIERESGFDSGPTAYAEVVNSVLSEEGVYTLYEKAKEKGLGGHIIDPARLQKEKGKN